MQTSKEKVTLFKSSEALQELVDKATPKKPINQSTPVVRQGYCPNCKGERLRINEDISKEVFNTILRELNTQKEKTIRDLAKFGVEYVDETA